MFLCPVFFLLPNVIITFVFSMEMMCVRVRVVFRLMKNDNNELSCAVRFYIYRLVLFVCFKISPFFSYSLFSTTWILLLLYHHFL